MELGELWDVDREARLDSVPEKSFPRKCWDEVKSEGATLDKIETDEEAKKSFEALEEVTGAGGQRRVRMSRGWVSMTSGTGKPLCVGEAAVQEFLSSVPLLQGCN